MKTITLLITILFMVLPLSAIDKGSWEIYTSYNGITEIEPAGNLVFALASNGLFSYHIKDGSVTTYDKANTLSDFDINHIAWNKTTKKLVITYTNGNIDLLDTNGNVVNVPDLYLKSMTGNKQINHINISGANVYLSLSFGIIKLDTKEGKILDAYKLGFNVNYSYIEDNCLYAASKEAGLYKGKLTGNLLNSKEWTKIGSYKQLSENKKLVYDKETGFWWTTTKKGKLTYYTVDSNNEPVYKTEGILPKGPASNNFYNLFFHNGKLYATGGFYAQENDGSYPGEVHVWDGENWSEFEQPSNDVLGHRNVDWLSMDFDPTKEGHVMVAAKSGLYEFQDGEFIKCYNRNNSPFLSCVNDDNYILVSDLMYDKEGTLWVFNSSVENCFWTLDKNQQWKSLDVCSQIKYNDDLRCLFISRTNNKMWFLSNYWQTSQLYAYDYIKNTLHTYGPTYINEDGVQITPNFFYKIKEDREGNIWMCTSSGPLYLSADNIRLGAQEVTQHKVPRNDGTNYADYLLDGIDTRSIAIDGGNRKWLGTKSNGVYLISSDCNTQIQHFTSENSPLLSNTILDILIEPSGKVYFATPKGLCSYMSDVTLPSNEMNKNDVYAYPNPVKPDYTGLVKIVGLTFDTDVKIVTSNGVLVNQGRSIGDTYTWNQCDLKGRKVSSGIYMVETATSEGERGVVCKIAIIK